MPSDSPMQIFLRDCDADTFYHHPGSWVKNPRDATVFETHALAIQARARLPNSKIELLVLDGQGRAQMGIRLWEGDIPIAEQRASLPNMQSGAPRNP